MGDYSCSYLDCFTKRMVVLVILIFTLLQLNESVVFATGFKNSTQIISTQKLTTNGTNSTLSRDEQPDSRASKPIKRQVEGADPLADSLSMNADMTPAARIALRRSSQLHDDVSKLAGNLANEMDDENVRTIPFYISIADLEKYSKSTNSIPIIVPAEAQLTEPNENESFEKRKKNFSKIAQSLILATKYVDKKSLVNGQAKTASSHDRQADSPIDLPHNMYAPTKEAPSSEQTRLKLFESGGYCQSKMDGLYDDPEDCENFIICYAQRTFITKCAYGTLWNHLRKECDFPENVDCERLPPTTPTRFTTTRTTTRRSTTILHIPKLSPLTITPHTVHKLKSNSSLASSIKTNILLTAILVPLALFGILIVVISLWFWKSKFRNQRKQLKLARAMQLSSDTSSRAGLRGNTTIPNSNTTSTTINHHEFHEDEPVLKKLASCCCYYRKLPNIQVISPRQFRPAMMENMGACAGLDSNMRSTSNSSTDDSNGPSMKKCMLNSVYPQSSSNSQQEFGMVAIDDCQIASGSHVTLSSHFEENNWDYNFATRGLYLSQPWVRGRYTQTLGSESLTTSAVLTLEPTTTEMSCCHAGVNTNHNGGAKMVEIYGNDQAGGSDTDGYYA